MAVDDAYSRYVMRLQPARYLRFRDIAVGHKACSNEVPFSEHLGLAAEASRCAYRSTLTGSHVVSGSLLPAFPGGTSLALASGQLVILTHNPPSGGLDASPSLALTNNYYCRPASFVNSLNFSVNYWYKNPSSGGTGYQRMVYIPTAMNHTTDNRSYDAFSTYNWHGGTQSDIALCRMHFKRRNLSLGGSYTPNMGNSETFRHMSAASSYAVGSVNMLTFVKSAEFTELYMNGVLQQRFTWQKRTYGMSAITYANDNTAACVIGAAVETPINYYGLGGSVAYEYSAAHISEFSLHDRALTASEVAELYSLGTTGAYTRRITGYVLDGAGAGISNRLVRAHGRKYGDVLGEATSQGDGSFEVSVPSTAIDGVYVLAFDDLGVAPDFNAAIKSDLVPRGLV